MPTLTKQHPSRVRDIRASIDDDDEDEKRQQRQRDYEERRRAKRPNRVRELRASMPDDDTSEERLLDKPEIITVTGKSYPTIWKWMQQGKFPRARDAHGRPVWLRSEVLAWMTDLPVKRFKGDR